MALTPHDYRSIAVASMVCERSVRRALAGQPLHALTFARIKAGLAQLGRLDLLPSSPLASDEPTPNQAA